jgi:hypothetical protein
MTKWVLMMTLVVSCIVATSAVAQVTIEVIEAGKSPFNASLAGFSEGTLNIVENGQPRGVSLKSLLCVKTKASRKPASGSLYVELRDGSRFRASALTGPSERLVCETNVGSLELDTKKIATCEFRKLNATQLEQWKALIDTQVKSDVLVVVRGEPESITFDFDGQSVDAPIGKLAGIKFFSPNSPNTGKSMAVVRDVRQNSWMIRSIQTTKNDRSRLILQCGATIELLNSDLQEIDFSSGSSIFLASLEPIERTSKPRGDIGIELPSLADVFGPRVVNAQDANGRATSNIEFVGAGTIGYRIPAEFVKLAGSVVLTPEGQQFHRCRAAVMLESKTLWEHTFDSPHKPQSFELAVASDQRLKLVVESVEEPPIGDTVVWSQLRLTK